MFCDSQSDDGCLCEYQNVFLLLSTFPMAPSTLKHTILTFNTYGKEDLSHILLFIKELTLYHTVTTFDALREKAFTHNVFYPMKHNFNVLSNIEFVTCKCCQFGQSPKNALVRLSLLGKTWSGQVDYSSLSNCRTSAKWQADE